MRHELKYIISPVQYYLLKGRLQPFLQRDKNAGADGNYFIRSIYFDSEQYRALAEKNMGIDSRKKYRLRFYNGNSQKCKLECKIKKGTRIDKLSAAVTDEEVKALLAGEVKFCDKPSEDVLGELQLLMRNEGFRARVVVDYLREAYVHPISNVRITFDKEIAAGTVDNCLEKRRCLSNILPAGHMVLEVKYDEYLPEHISNILASIRPVQTAASKYVMCVTERLERKIV